MLRWYLNGLVAHILGLLRNGTSPNPFAVCFPNLLRVAERMSRDLLYRDDVLLDSTFTPIADMGSCRAVFFAPCRVSRWSLTLSHGYAVSAVVGDFDSYLHGAHRRGAPTGVRSCRTTNDHGAWEENGATPPTSPANIPHTKHFLLLHVISMEGLRIMGQYGVSKSL